MFIPETALKHKSLSLMILITLSINEAYGKLDDAEQETIDQLFNILQIDHNSIEAMPLNMNLMEFDYTPKFQTIRQNTKEILPSQIGRDKTSSVDPPTMGDPA